MNAITAGMLTLESELPDIDILEFEIKKGKNTHSQVKITGILSEETGIIPILKKLEGIPLKVISMMNDSPILLFCGFIYNLKIRREGNGSIVVLEGISSTQLLDREKRCRSFQNIDMTYKELVRSVLSDTPGAQVIFNIKDKKIGRPIYQYQETDWDFLKRIASHLRTSLVAADISVKPELYFGLPQGRKREVREPKIERIWFNKTYYQFCCQQRDVSKSHFIHYDVINHDYWTIGDRLSFAGIGETAIMALTGKLEKGIMVFSYQAASEKAFGTARYEVDHMAGVSLLGTVLETRGEFLRIWLDIDRTQPVNQAYWYPWMPENGNLMYCMPQVGERVEITFDDNQGNARGNKCVRTNGSENKDIKKPSNRYFTSMQRKRMYLKPEEIGFTDLKQSVSLKMEINDNSGITVVYCLYYI